MAAGAYTLARTSVHDVLAAAMAVAAFAVLWRGLLPPIAVVGLGGVIGWLAGA
jgi:chromate transport protein ChrA